jgi:tRNA/tmRNA/rRNA uracil-C5-methylase (TrmA/RlmC/RlmD family)
MTHQDNCHCEESDDAAISMRIPDSFHQVRADSVPSPNRVICGNRCNLWIRKVLDPFCGTGTTMLAAIKTGRSSIGVEIDRAYCQMALRRLERETRSLFSGVEVTFTTAAEMRTYPPVRAERVAAVSDAPRRRRIQRN